MENDRPFLDTLSNEQFGWLQQLKGTAISIQDIDKVFSEMQRLDYVQVHVINRGFS